MVADPGRVVSTRFPYIPVTVTVRDKTEEVEALLDTGFDGYVIVPLEFVSDLDEPDARLEYALADGSPLVASVYRGEVHIGPYGPYRTIVTILGDEPIVGRRLTERFTVTLDHGRQVVVEL